MKRFAYLFLALLSVVLFAACQKKEAPQAKAPAAPPPPTAEQIASEIRNKVTPLLMQLPTPLLKQQLSSTISGLKNQYAAAENGPKALSMVRGEYEAQIKPAFDGGQFQQTLVLCDVVDAFQPGGPTAQRFRERALIEFNKPRVTIQAWVKDEATNKIFVFLKIVLPETAQADSDGDGKVTYDELHKTIRDLTEDEFRKMDNNRDGVLTSNEVQFPIVVDKQVNEGEEFYGLKLVQIIGKQQGITLEYGRTGERFDVMYSQK